MSAAELFIKQCIIKVMVSKKVEHNPKVRPYSTYLLPMSVIGILIIVVYLVVFGADKKQVTPTEPIKQPTTTTAPSTQNETPSPAPTPNVEEPPTTPPAASKKSASVVAPKAPSAPAVETPVVTPPPLPSPQIVTTDRVVSASTSGLTQIDFTGIFDAGYGSQAPIAGVIDDGFIPIPTTGFNFNFFGTDYAAANQVSWSSNNALVFGTTPNPNTVSYSGNTAPAILLGNYDRMVSGLYHSTTTSSDTNFEISTILVTFANYYTDSINLTIGTQRIRLIKEISGQKRQWVEVSVISAPASPGYSNNPLVSYPSGVDIGGNAIDSNGLVIDSTKGSPYNITSGTTFLNLLGSLYSSASPPSGTSFIFQSDELGNNWTFTNNAYVNL